MKNKIKLILGAAAIAILSITTMVVKGYIEKYASLEEEMVSYRNNQLAYENQIYSLNQNNRVLMLSELDLRDSNDKLILAMDSVRKSVKQAKNKPGDVSVGVVTTVNAVDTAKINNKVGFELDTTITYNEMTTLGVKIKNDSLITVLDINNVMYLYVYSREEYVNTYKNGWIRFWHFDWKKMELFRYDIKNSNDLILIDQIKVYKIRE